MKKYFWGVLGSVLNLIIMLIGIFVAVISGPKSYSNYFISWLNRVLEPMGCNSELQQFIIKEKVRHALINAFKKS